MTALGHDEAYRVGARALEKSLEGIFGRDSVLSRWALAAHVRTLGDVPRMLNGSEFATLVLFATLALLACCGRSLRVRCRASTHKPRGAEVFNLIRCLMFLPTRVVAGGIGA